MAVVVERNIIRESQLIAKLNLEYEGIKVKRCRVILVSFCFYVNLDSRLN